MVQIFYQNKPLSCAPEESVLDCLERHNLAPRSSCRSGICQSCTMAAPNASLPAKAQQGLKDAWKQQGIFLACVCRPTEDLTIFDLDDATTTTPGTITQIEPVTDDIARVWIQAPGLAAHAGQYVQVIHPDGETVRPYSLANGGRDGLWELHVRRLPQGRMSAWLTNQKAKGQTVLLRGPAGDCFYDNSNQQRPLLLVGTSTGLAPLWGIVHDALAQGHHGPILLVHGALETRGLYLGKALASLAVSHENVRVVRCVLRGPTPEGVQESDVRAIVEQQFSATSQAKAFLCGSPDIVKRLRKQLFLAGMNLSDIAADPFIVAPQ